MAVPLPTGVICMPIVAKKSSKHCAEVDSTAWGGRPDLMELSVPNYRETRKGEPEDVNAFGRFPWQAGKFVDRPDSPDQQ